LKDAMWQLEPPVRYWRRDGSELPFPPPERDNYHTWEVLVQRAQGRYLQLRLRLYGDGRTTPRVRAMRVYYPRFSYLTHYLPAIYRDDSRSASLLDRYLANIEGIYTAIEDRIAAVQMLFDPLNAPAGVLEWLAQWFGVALDPAWEESRRRLFIQHAMVFFQYRGTVRGLKMALQLALSPCVDEHIFDEDSDDDPRAGNIRIIERFRTRQAAGVEVGDPTTGGGGTDANTAHYFSVLLPTPRLENNLTVEQIDRRVQEQRELGARIINLEKPAHTLFDIRFYWAAFRLGEVRLGIDTLIDLGSRSPQFIAAMILDQGYLGETYLAPGHPQNVPDRLVLGRDRLHATVGSSAYVAPHREDGDDE
jgi:phage tail-like protein